MWRPVTIFLLAYVSLPWGSGQLQSAEGDSNTAQDGPIKLTFSQTTPLKAILRIAMERKVSLGIVFGARPFLCMDKSDLQIDARDARGALDQILVGSGYEVSVENGVYVLRAADITPHESSLLNYRFDRFSSTNSTMADAGALLDGYILSVAEGGGGFAIHSSSSPSAKTFSIKMQNATTTEIANRIVSLDRKGVWVFYPTPSRISESEGDTPIQVFAYNDNAAGLESLACGIAAKGSQ